MGEDHEDRFFRLAAGARDMGDELLVFLGAEQAMIERDENLTRLRGREVRVSRLEHSDGGAQWPMNAGRAVVLCGAPHAMVNARRWRDVGPGEREATAALGRVYFSDRRARHRK